MGVMPAVDFFQGQIMVLLCDLTLVIIYLDDVLCLENVKYSKNMELVAKVIA